MNNSSVDIFENSRDVWAFGSVITVAGSQQKTTFERERRPTSPRIDACKYAESNSPTMAVPLPQSTSSSSDQRAVDHLQGMSIFRDTCDIRMSHSRVTAAIGSQDILVLPNRVKPEMDILHDEELPVFGTIPQRPGRFETTEGYGDTRSWRLNPESGAKDTVNTGHSFKRSVEPSQYHTAHNPAPPMSRNTFPKPAKEKNRQYSRRQGGSDYVENHAPLGQLHFLDSSTDPRLQSTSVFRTATDKDRIHHIHQSRPGMSSSFQNPGTNRHPTRDPQSLVQDERNGDSRRGHSNDRDVHLFSRSKNADIQDTTFHVTDRSEGAIELPSNPSEEYTRAVAAIRASSANTAGPGPAMTYMDRPGQQPYIAQGHMARGSHFSSPDNHGHVAHGPQFGHGSPPPSYNTSNYGNPMQYPNYHAPTAQMYASPPANHPPPTANYGSSDPYTRDPSWSRRQR
ncbi:hypothetical protein VKT23_020316 [Stygiomarasmius scandens]|uniref:Uncharacterized protein n=1 Tax=Marasmiellus scandens TaxID=2682957 RepID=A0ABR1INA0_9AGAR